MDDRGAYLPAHPLSVPQSWSQRNTEPEPQHLDPR